jgi:autotransporter-associated beta strand protein
MGTSGQRSQSHARRKAQVAMMLAAGTVVFGKTHASLAQIPAYYWSGGGSAPFDWSNGSNWSSGPSYGILYFGGTNGTTNTVDSGFNENVLQWNNSTGWTLNSGGSGDGVTLYDYGGSQAKLENLGSGSVTVNAPITFAATTGNPYAEINAISGDFTFAAGGTISVSGSAVQGLRFWGNSSHTTNFNNTVNASGDYLTTPGGGNINIGATGSVTAGTVSIINGAALTLTSGGALTANAINLGNDFGESGFANTAQSAAFNLAGASGGQNVGITINSQLNTSNAVAINSQNTSGTNTLSGIIALGGNLAINQTAGGTLALAGSSYGIDLSTNTLTLGGGGTINISDPVFSDSNAASAGLTYAGTGTAILAGSNSYTGTTTITSGTVLLGNVNSTGSSTVIVNSNNGLLFSPSGSTYVLGALGGSGNFALTATDSSAITVDVGSNGASTTLSGNLSGNGSLSKSGSGTLTLSGSDTYSGTTTVNAGVLSLDHSGTNTGQLTNSAVTVTSNGTLNAKGAARVGSSLISSGSLSLVDGSINTLTVGGGISLSSTTLDFELGSGADRITTTGAATVAGTNTINLSQVPGQTVSAGTYTLLSASTGFTAGGAGFAIGTKPSGFFNFSLSTSTTTQEILTIAGNATPNTAYWSGVASRTGSPSDSFDYWGYGSSLSTAKSNWSTTSNGLSDPLQVPGSNTDVIFAATNATANVSTSLQTVLDASYSIKSLTVNEPSTNLITSTVVNTFGNTLSVGTGGFVVASTSNSGGTIAGTGTVTILNNQSWANNSNSQGLAVNTSVGAAAGVSTLTLSGTGTGGVILGGPIGNGASSALTLVANQAGVTQLNGTNTFTGGLVINSGTVQLGNASAINPSAAVVTFGAGSTGALRLNGNSITLTDLNTNATVGTPIITGDGSSNASTLVLNTSNVDTFGGSLQDGGSGGTLSLTLGGSGTLKLTGSSSYSGATTINSGTLQIGSNGTTGALSGSTSINFGSGTLNTLAFTRTDGPTFAGNIFMSASFGENGNVFVASGDSVTLTGSITGNGGEFWTTGPGTVVITPNAGSSSDNSSNVVENGGALSLSDFSSSSLGNGNFYIGAGNTSGAISYTGASTSTSRIGPYFLQGTANYIGVTNPTTTLTISGAIGQTGVNSLTTTGSGTLLLSAANTYSGATNVTAGVLDVTGSIASSGSINVTASNNGATLILDGSNAINSFASVTGATTGSALPQIIANSSQNLGIVTNVGTTNFTSGNSTIYQLAGTGTLAVGSGATVNVSNSLTHGGIISSGTINVNGGSSNTITGSIDDPSVGQTSYLLVANGANLTAAHIRQGVLDISTGSTVTIPSNPSGAFNPTSSTPSPTISVVNDLYNNGGSTSLTSGTLDLKNNALIVNDPSEASSIIAAVYNAADFNPSSGSNQWDKPGITTSSALANASSYALGSLTGTELANLGSTTFQGLPVTSNSTVVSYTLIGDTELRGTVDGTDYNNVLANYDTAGDWSQGNFYNESIVSGDDYNAVLNVYDVAASGAAKGLKPAITRSLSPAVSPVATSGTFHLEVNTTSGDVVIFNDSTSSAPLTLYNIVDGSQQDLLIGNPADGNGTSGSIESGTPPYTNEHFLSVAQNDSNAVASITGRSSTNYKAWSLVLDGYNSNATALALSEGGVANKTDTINVPSYYSIDLGDIFNVGTTTVALTFQWGTETSSGGEGGTVYSNQPIDYIGTPEPASLGLLGLGGLAMMRRRRKA